MFRLPIAALLFVFACAAPAGAQSNRDVLVAVAEKFVIPRYDVLARETAAQEDAWNRFCAAPARDAFPTLQEAYRKAADAWSGIEFVLYGPISVDFRFEHMAHWPERQNATNRALATLLSRTNDDDLTPDRFSQVSAAGQGLTALERLLFDANAEKAFFDGSDVAKRRCGVGRAIAHGLATTSALVLQEWRRPGGTLSVLQTGDANVLDDAATRFATDYIGLFEIIDDQKLGLPMGKSIDDARPALAEGWRSKRSLRAIAVNLEAAQAMGKLLLDPASDEGASLVYALRTPLAMAEALGQADIGTLAGDKKQRAKVVLLRDAVHSLREVASFSVPNALGVTMGFNSRDGD